MKSSDPSASALQALADALKSSKDPRIVILNKTRSTELANHADLAHGGGKRSKGLLGRAGLGPGEGMWIVPCEAVHTFFMKFAIDLVYLDRKLRVKKTRHAVGPWRFSACLSAHSVIELPAGTIRATQTECGDIIQISDRAQTGGVS